MTRNEWLVSAGRRLRRLGDGPLRGVPPVVHRTVTSAELAILPRLEARGREMPSLEESARLTDRVTMIVKTFERPDVVRRLVRTARTVFPGRIVVADDSRTPLRDLGPGVDIVSLPFNVGLSSGRNAALARVTTECTFLTDDDIVFTAASDIVAMREYLDEHPDVDIIAPALVNLPWLYTSHRRESPLFTGALPPLREAFEWAEDLATAAPLTLAYSKRVLESMFEPRPWAEDLDDDFAAVWESENVEEGVLARLEQRQPDSQGR